MEPGPHMRASDGIVIRDLVPAIEKPLPTEPIGYDHIIDYEEYLH